MQQQQVLLHRCTFAMEVQMILTVGLIILTILLSLAQLLRYTDELILACQKLGGCSQHRFSCAFISHQPFCKVCCRQSRRVRIEWVVCTPATYSPWKLRTIFWHDKQMCHRNVRYSHRFIFVSHLPNPCYT